MKKLITILLILIATVNYSEARTRNFTSLGGEGTAAEIQKGRNDARYKAAQEARRIQMEDDRAKANEERNKAYIEEKRIEREARAIERERRLELDKERVSNDYKIKEMELKIKQMELEFKLKATNAPVAKVRAKSLSPSASEHRRPLINREAKNFIIHGDKN